MFINSFKKFILILAVLLFMHSVGARSQTTDQFKEQFMREYNPQGYAYYKFGEGIVDQGKQIADNLYRSLSKNQKLINTTDPDALLADFNSKMQNIESLEAAYIQQSNQFSFEQGQQIGDMINSGDTEGAVVGALSALSTFSEEKRAKEELEAQKTALIEQRRQQMSQIYWKALEFNENTQRNYLKRAAFAEDVKDEQYNLNIIENLKCFAKRMNNNWSSTHTSWLNNTCPQPEKPTLNSIENKFIGKDLQYSRIAERKYEFYQKSGAIEFLQAAISYQAAAAKINATASHFYQLGVYYTEESTILALSTILTAKQLDHNIFDAQKQLKLQQVTQNAEVEISMALKANNKVYLSAFLDAGLDKTIKIYGNDILIQAISQDQPDALQLILNKYIEGISQEQINAKLQKTVMLCAVKNSTACLRRFIELGVSTEFTLRGYSPVDVANKMRADEAYQLLVQNSGRQKHYQEKYKNSDTQLLATAKSDPLDAASKIDAISSATKRAQIIQKMIDDMDTEPMYFTVFEKSYTARTDIQSNIDFQNQIKQKFFTQLKITSPDSKAYLYVKAKLVAEKHIPVLSEISPVVKEAKKISVDNEAISVEKKLAILFTHLKGSYLTLEEVATNEYYTEDMKIRGLKSIKNIINLVQDYMNNPSLSEKDNRTIDSMLFSVLATDYNGKYGELRNDYYNYFRNTLQVVDHVALEEKIDAVILNLKNYEVEFSSDVSLPLKTFELYRTKDELASYEVAAIDIAYGSAAITFQKPIDKASLQAVLTNSFSSTSSPSSGEDIPQDEGLAYIAFLNKNYELFSALDERYDLSTVSTSSGESLFESMLKSSYPNIGYHEAFLSDDFDFQSQIDGKPAIVFYLEGNIDKENSYYNSESLNMILTHLKNINLRVTENEGTLLHYGITALSKDQYSLSLVLNLLEEFHNHKVDKTLTDANGNTAWQLFKDNEKSIKDRFSEDYKIWLEANNIGMKNYLTKSEWKKMEELFILYLLDK